MSLRGQAEARSCDHLFAELYTNSMPALNLRNLSALVGKEVAFLFRKDIEETPETLILSRARAGKVGFLVPGDPMVATTHVDLRLRAHKAGIKTRIVHAASVVSAIAGVTGLQSYKFGRTVTIPASSKDEVPQSIYLAIRNNMAMGLHSLVLMEIDVEGKRAITIPEALSRFLSYSERKHERVITGRTLVVGAARLEAPDMIVKAGTVDQVACCDFGGPPFIIVFPGQLHFVEAEALRIFCGAPEELMSK
jgi:diphthine synthase